MDLADAERKTRSTYDLCSVGHTSLSQIFLHFLTFFFFCFVLVNVFGLDPAVWIRVCYIHVCCNACFSPFFFFLFNRKGWYFNHEQCIRILFTDHKYHFLINFSLKTSLMTLFTHLKIILLQCFQFSVFSFSKINSIQTVPCQFSLYCYLLDENWWCV